MCVEPVEYGERHYTHGQTGCSTTPQPTNQVSAWQLDGEVAQVPTRRHPREDPREETAFVEKLYRARCMCCICVAR